MTIGHFFQFQVPVPVPSIVQASKLIVPVNAVVRNAAEKIQQDASSQIRGTALMHHSGRPAPVAVKAVLIPMLQHHAI